MQQPTDENKPGILSVFKSKCPRCRKGDMFLVANPYHLQTTMRMYADCPVCAQPYVLEVGFYYGSSYVSYAITVALSVASFIAWLVFFGFSVHDNSVFYWLGFNAIFLIGLQPVLMRLARRVWLGFFVRYEPKWKTIPAEKPERTNKDQENNW